jgi:hypothetical protein
VKGITPSELRRLILLTIGLLACIATLIALDLHLGLL